MVNVYRVELITERSEMEQAQEQLIVGTGSDYVILRVNEGPSGNEHRANQRGI
jgi:hypothetical protein